MSADWRNQGDERWWLRVGWAVPFALATVIVGCSSTDSDEPTSAGEPHDLVTVPSSRPSPAGPTTSIVEFDGFLFERTPSVPESAYDYSIDVPAHIPAPNDVPEENPQTDAGATLGRVLFYDVNLSRGRTLSCASCHLQSNSFTDRTPQSLGQAGQRTRRNSMSLANLAFNENGRFFWDERAGSLEAQSLEPFADPAELALPLDEVVARILGLAYYEPLFVDAYGAGAFDRDGVTPQRVAEAMSQFMRAMVSVSAPYDEGRAQVDRPTDDFPNFSNEENLGKLLFFLGNDRGSGACADCHRTELFLTPPTDGGTNGLDDGSASTDLGVFEITGDPAQLGSFRVSSLRNIAVTGPYMHDGRLRSLADVVDHYSTGIAAHPNLGAPLTTADGEPTRFDFTPEERSALAAFLETLTDTEFLRDPRFSDPFAR